ncbi:SubName: Full=Related to kinesin light chain {ECO:0000313/EMBL:CCA76682.1} [Serendipita indica DSM 11827]|nr:SubName: Full=Related to kinesin light chain {ECO:0000313/EMBL:CCA76682.1} [Serendipita indica DSM 11827]
MSLFEHSTESGFTTYSDLDDCPPPESDKIFISNLQEILGSTWNEVEFQEIVESATRASFVDVSTDGLFYTVHPLLQMYIKDCLSEDDNRHYARTTTQLVLGAIRPLIPLSAQSENATHALAFHKLYDSLGDGNACRELLESALSQIQQHHGQRHKSSMWDDARGGCSAIGDPQTTAPRYSLAKNNLASTLHSRDQLEDAEKIRREVLALQLEILGARHPETISTMGNLAITLHPRGQLEEAERIMRLRNPETIWAMSNLASILHSRGQLKNAEKMKREVFALRLEILGPRHPDTILAMGNLAISLQSCRQLEEAEKIQREALALQMDILGSHHLGTVRAMNNLLVTFHDRGQLDEAEKMSREYLLCD